MQDVDYRPHIALSFTEPHGCVELDREDDDEEEMARQRSLEALFGRIVNAGPKPVFLLSGGVLLGPRHRDDPEYALTVPLHRTLGPSSECSFGFSLLWSTIWDVARHFDRTSIDCLFVLKVRGADGVVREVKRPVGTAMQCEDNEWVFIEPHYFAEIMNDLQQVRLQQRLRPT